MVNIEPFVPNNVCIFAKGANWVPPDSLEGRVDKGVFCELLESARDMNANFLRIWGGGVYVQDAFFDCADEYGLLLEQDGIFSNGVYESDPEFLRLIGDEISYQTRRLASHPSLFMWTGSNEISETAMPTSWDPIFLHTFFPNISAIDQSRYGVRCTFTDLLLYHAMPCHAMPCHAIPYHTIPYHTIPYHTIPYHTVPYQEPTVRLPHLAP